MSQFDVRVPGTRPQPKPARRVRDEVRDGIAVAGASLAASVVLVALASLLMKFAG